MTLVITTNKNKGDILCTVLYIFEILHIMFVFVLAVKEIGCVSISFSSVVRALSRESVILRSASIDLKKAFLMHLNNHPL